ncbi:MAG: hypothetical protein APR55_08045 [Methanolinea sp. SDB]|nr:MAG: hypothetical protein APR55_08045 [Methanolinea sp. SDB]
MNYPHRERYSYRLHGGSPFPRRSILIRPTEGILELTIPEKGPQPEERPGKIEIRENPHLSLTRVEFPLAYFWYS